MKKLFIISEIIIAILIILSITLSVRCFNLQRELKTYSEENESQSLIEENVSLTKVDPPSVSIYENAGNQYCRRPANSVGCVVAEGMKCDLVR